MSYNRSYHGFFEGYSEMDVLDSKTGKTRIERIYTGDYYMHDISDEQLKKTKWFYGLSLVWSTCALISQFFNISTNVWYTVLPLVMLLVSLVWNVIYTVAYISHERKLNIRQYRDREKMRAAAAACALFFGIAAVGEFAWLVVYRKLYIYAFISIIIEIFSCFLMQRVYVKERDMDYIKIENPIKAKADSYEIKFKEIEE